MKIVVLGDSHFGVRSDKIAFHKYFQKFYQKSFFPYLWEHSITQVIQTGDLFDRRKFVNYNTLHLSKRYFFNEFGKAGMTLHVFPGNHDIYWKNSLKVNSIESNLQDFIVRGAIKVYTHPTTVEFEGFKIDMIPWITPENHDEIVSFIEKSVSPCCVGHFELSGFESDKGHVCSHGMDRSVLKRYELAISGHFHHRSTDGQIFYVGAPCEHTWADFEDPKGFHVLDTVTRELEFIRNPYAIHVKTQYDDGKLTLQQIESMDFSKEIHECIVKVVVNQKNNPVMFDAYMDRIYAAEPLDVTIVEVYSNPTNGVQLSETDDTFSMITKSVDALELDGNIDRGLVKGYLKDLYQEAMSHVD